MSSQVRRAAIAAYKERKTVPGIYAVRCAATGEAWVGSCPDVDKIQNRTWFGLKAGSFPIPSLMQAWKTHGEAAFTLEIVEQVKPAESAYLTDRLLKDRADHWRGTLLAKPI
ncbi:GIY-YIG nuclease family protein [Zavarzinia sp. CC-PAN008]|uniref:GIY-YIG nuclease family protein n=1 Tax=Zavarzinia sp. CC-PAN008 TaxID=3243332 RepID=UPI003F74A4B4